MGELFAIAVFAIVFIATVVIAAWALWQVYYMLNSDMIERRRYVRQQRKRWKNN
jgi:type VI protein secretion system component VasK